MDERELDRIRMEWEDRYTAKPLSCTPFALTFLALLSFVLLAMR